MTIFDKIKDNPAEKIDRLNDLELLQALLEGTHNRHPKKLAQQLLANNRKLYHVIDAADELFANNIINENFYCVAKVIQILQLPKPLIINANTLNINQK